METELQPSQIPLCVDLDVATLAYTCWTKQVPLVEVLVLAGLCIIRVVGEAAAANAPLSFWMMAFAVIFFFSLRLAKRFLELRQLRRANEEKLKGGQYVARDLQQSTGPGAASGYLFSSRRLTRSGAGVFPYWFRSSLLLC